MQRCNLNPESFITVSSYMCQHSADLSLNIFHLKSTVSLYFLSELTGIISGICLTWKVTLIFFLFSSFSKILNYVDYWWFMLSYPFDDFPVPFLPKFIFHVWTCNSFFLSNLSEHPEDEMEVLLFPCEINYGHFCPPWAK